MKKSEVNRIVIGIIIVVAGVILLGWIFLSDNLNNDEVKEDRRLIGIEGSSQSLGNLCSGKEECIDFCDSNRGRCEGYCRENKNELCKIIFPSEGALIQNNFDLTEETEEDCSQFSFMYYIIEPKYIRTAGQIGWIGGGNTEILGTSYIFIKDEFTNQKIPVYAPRDAVLFAATLYMPPDAPENHVPDHGLVFDFGCEYSMTLGHIKEVTDPIKERMPPLNRQSSATQQVTPLNIKAGELIGYIHKTSSAASMDFIIENRNVRNKFINQERYEARFVGSNSVHRVCPYDLYQGEMKEEYYALLPQRNCGTMERDKIGTIAGQWFLNQDPVTGVRIRKEGYYGSPLPIVLKDQMIQIGHIGGEKDIPATGDMRIYLGNPTYKDPKEVTSEYCYQNYPMNPSIPQGYVYFKIIDNITMDVYYSETGSCPSTFPSSEAKRYYR